MQVWDEAEGLQVADFGPHTAASFMCYLQWYQPRTRCRLAYPDIAPEPHVASSYDGYARYRDTELAAAVRHMIN
jgi:hypothetical protein